MAGSTWHDVVAAAQGRYDMKQRHQRQLPVSVVGLLLAGVSAASLSASASLAATPPDPAAACAKLATLAGFPVAPTQIPLAKFGPGGTSTHARALPDHCQGQG